MKDFILKYKMFLLILIITIICILLITQSLAMSEYEKIDYNLGIVNTDYLNMRSGSNINFDAIDLLTKNEYVRIFGRINDWYIVQNEEDKIGTVHVNYITPVQEEKASATNTEIIQENSLLTEDENYLLELINAERRKHNLNDLKIDKELQNIAILKANDLVNNNYFSHPSICFGSVWKIIVIY